MVLNGEKYFLGHRGLFLLQYHKWLTGKIGSQAESPYPGPNHTFMPKTKATVWSLSQAVARCESSTDIILCVQLNETSNLRSLRWDHPEACAAVPTYTTHHFLQVCRSTLFTFSASKCITACLEVNLSQRERFTLNRLKYKLCSVNVFACSLSQSSLSP